MLPQKECCVTHHEQEEFWRCIEREVWGILTLRSSPEKKLGRNPFSVIASDHRERENPFIFNVLRDWPEVDGGYGCAAIECL